MKNRWIPIVAIAAAVAAYLLTLFYQRNFEARLTQDMRRVQIVVAKRSIAAQTVLTRDDLVQDTVFAGSLTRRAVEADQWQEIVGKRILQSVERGEPVYWSDLDLPRAGRGGLQAAVPKGERAISLSVDQVSSVTGLVRPNDHVDILGSFTMPALQEGAPPEMVTLTLLQDVTVLATGTDMGRRYFREGPLGSEPAAGRYSTVTLAVTPEEAEMLAFTSQQGRLALSLRNVEDIGVAADLPRVDFQYVADQIQRLNEERQNRIRGGAPR